MTTSSDSDLVSRAVELSKSDGFLDGDDLLMLAEQVNHLRGLLAEWFTEENNAEFGSEEHAEWYGGFLRRVREVLGK